jgi:hypothetical protein
MLTDIIMVIFANLILIPTAILHWECWYANDKLINVSHFFGVNSNQYTCEVNSKENHIITEYTSGNNTKFIDATHGGLPSDSPNIRFVCCKDYWNQTNSTTNSGYWAIHC